MSTMNVEPRSGVECTKHTSVSCGISIVSDWEKNDKEVTKFSVQYFVDVTSAGVLEYQHIW